MNPHPLIPSRQHIPTQVVNGSMSVGDFVAVNAYVAQAFQPLNFLGSVYTAVIKARSFGDRWVLWWLERTICARKCVCVYTSTSTLPSPDSPAQQQQQSPNPRKTQNRRSWTCRT